MKQMNANNLNQKQMMGMQGNMSSFSFMQKIGKGKRKNKVRFEKMSLSFLKQFAIQLKKYYSVYGANGEMGGLISFLDYIIDQTKQKNTEINFSFEEIEFLRKILSEQIKVNNNMDLKWYNFLKKIRKKVSLNQFKTILKDLNK